MSAQRKLFDKVEGERLRERGMAISAAARAELLILAQACAREVCQRDGDADMDRVFQLVIKQGFEPEDLGNAAGSVFRGWIKIGRKNSERKSNHARSICIWRMK